MPELVLSLLGNPKIVRDGKQVTHFRSVKVIALLTVLAIESDHAHSRDKLAGMFWPDQPDAVARQNLSQTLTRLRHALADDSAASFFSNTPQDIRFQLTPRVWLDVAELTAAESATHTLEHLEFAVQLYRGDLLHGFFMEGCPTFQEWLTVKRAELLRHAIKGLEQLTEKYIERREYQRAIQYARRALELEPWLERAHRQLLRALTLDGQRAGALAQYREFNSLLQKELGIEPEHETIHLAERIRQGELTAPESLLASHHLPTPSTAFVGRERELGELVRLVQSPACRLVTIVGLGGMGKTRLALKLAADLAHTFPDGTYFVPFTSQHSPAEVAPTIAAELGLSLQPGGDPISQLEAVLCSKRLLLILDNFECVLAARNTIARLARAAGTARLVVTSRVPLRTSNEHVYTVYGLENAQANAVNTGRSDAMQLFAHVAWRRHPEVYLTEAALAIIRRICERVEGMPLAIEMAAAWTDTLSLDDILRELERAPDFLETDSHDLAERHANIRLVLAGTWQSLTRVERQVFARFAVFRGGFTRRAAEQVAGATLPILRALVQSSLLRVENISERDNRYHVHELLRRYAQEQLDRDPATRTDTRRAHANYYMAWLAQFSDRLNAAEPYTAAQEIQTEINNIRHAWEWSIEDGIFECLAQGAEALSHFHQYEMWMTESATAMERASARVADALTEDSHSVFLRSLWAHLTTRRMRALYFMGQFDTIVPLGMNVLKIGEALQRPDLLAEANLIVGVACVARDELAQGKAYLLAGLELVSQAIPDPVYAKRVEQTRWPLLWGLGNVTRAEGELTGARHYLARALEAAYKIQDLGGVSSVLQSLARVACSQRDGSGQRVYLEQALQVSIRTRHRRTMLDALSDLGALHQERQDYGAAHDYLTRALDLAQEMGMSLREPELLLHLGTTALRQGNAEGARSIWERAMTLAVHNGQSQIQRQAQEQLMLLYSA